MSSWTPGKLPDRFPKAYLDAIEVTWNGKSGEVHRTLIGWVAEEKGLKTVRNKFSSFKAALHRNPKHRLHGPASRVKHTLVLQPSSQGFDVIAVTEKKWLETSDLAIALGIGTSQNMGRTSRKDLTG